MATFPRSSVGLYAMSARQSLVAIHHGDTEHSIPCCHSTERSGAFSRPDGERRELRGALNHLRTSIPRCAGCAIGGGVLGGAGGGIRDGGGEGLTVGGCGCCSASSHPRATLKTGSRSWLVWLRLALTRTRRVSVGG